MNAHPYDDIEVFALGGLDADASQRLLAHADACPTCAILVSEAMTAVSALEPADEKPIGQTRSVASRVYSRRRNTVSWIAGIAAAAAILTLAIYTYDVRSNGLTVPIAALVHSHFQHHALRGSMGSVKVIQAVDGSWLYLVGDGLPPKSNFVLSEVSNGNEREVGSFSTNARGQASAYWPQPTTKIQGLVVRTKDQQPYRGPELRWP